MGIISEDEIEGMRLQDKAEAVLAQFTSFNKTMKYQDACELFEQAAVHFELVRLWREAAVALQKSAECRERLAHASQAAIVYAKAAEYHIRGSAPLAAVQCWQEAIALYTKDGRFHIAAEHAFDVGSLLRSHGDWDEAAKYFLRAREFYDSVNMFLPSVQMLREHARALVMCDDLVGGQGAFAMLFKQLQHHDLLKLNAKDALLWCIVCSLLQRRIKEARSSLKFALTLDPTLKYSREETLALKLIEVVKKRELHTFADVVYSFASVRELDFWELTTLGKLQAPINSQPKTAAVAAASSEEKGKSNTQSKLLSA